MRWFLFEDRAAKQLSPVALTRPVFELICGRECLRRRLQRWFPTAEWGVHVRSWLREVYSEEQPDCAVNDLPQLANSQTLMVNGRWMPKKRLNSDEVTLDNAGFIDGHLAWIALEPEEAALLTASDFDEILLGIARTRRVVDASGVMISYPWDVVNHNPTQLQLDFEDEGVSQPCVAAHVQILGSESDVYISASAEIDPYVVIDARNGPVSIDRDVRIQSFTRLEGPCHIARQSQIFRGLIREGTTIGVNCRIGGEVEQSVLHSHVNKYHDGFLGHSYVCPWVNIGAISTTSDLKSDYSSVRVAVNGELVDSGSMKVGSFIGDHTKTAIDSMFNAGSSIGVMASCFPAAGCCRGTFLRFAT